MNLFTKQFTFGHVTGTLRRWNEPRSGFDQALYIRALGKIYADVADDVRSAFLETTTNVDNAPLMMDVLSVANPMIRSSLAIFGEIERFARMAVHIRAIGGLMYDWPKATADPHLIDEAFQDFLDDEDGLWAYVTDLIEALDRPNGPEGAPIEALTEAEKKDTFLAGSENAGGSVNGRDMTITPIASTD